jgi:hypothetical protein
MSKEEIKELSNFLKPFPAGIRELTCWLREFIWDLYPDCNELIYDNYNALAIGFGPSDRAGDVFCGIAVYSNHVNFGFNRGSELADKGKILKGNGNFYRYITIKEKKDFPVEAIKKLLKEAHINSVLRLKEDKHQVRGITITKSISANQRRPG